VLFLVATPIGNLKDITFRAVEVLKECDVLVAEDSRRLSILAGTYDLGKKKVVVYNEYNEKKRTESIIALLKDGKRVALTSDAGTPLVGDPGYLLVKRAVEEGIPVVPVPGPCALVSAVICSGFPLNRFTCHGFLPRRDGKKRKVFGEMTGTAVFFESPHRIHKTLALLAEIVPDAEIVLAREMTKIHEEFIRGRVKDVNELLKGRRIKGEITVVVHVPPRGHGEEGEKHEE